MKWLTDPLLFNYLLIGLQVAAAVRLAIAGRWWDTLYWVFATGLVAVVTSGRLGR